MAEEQLKLELDTLGGDVSRRFAGVEAEAERTRKRLAKERKDLEALEGLVQVGVWVNTQPGQYTQVAVGCGVQAAGQGAKGPGGAGGPGAGGRVG